MVHKAQNSKYLGLSLHKELPGAANIMYTGINSVSDPPPVTMYDLIRSALRSRPHGVVIGEARGMKA